MREMVAWQCLILWRQKMTEERKKYIEQWWRKYEAMGDLDAEFPPSRELVFSLVNSAYFAWLHSGNAAAHIEAEISHHICVRLSAK